MVAGEALVAEGGAAVEAGRVGLRRQRAGEGEGEEKDEAEGEERDEGEGEVGGVAAAGEGIVVERSSKEVAGRWRQRSVVAAVTAPAATRGMLRRSRPMRVRWQQ